jgi:hypothetical protein
MRTTIFILVAMLSVAHIPVPSPCHSPCTGDGPKPTPIKATNWRGTAS